jgi:hypothetical protein
MISNLLTETKAVVVDGKTYVLKKWPKRLTSWITSRQLENAKYDEERQVFTGINLRPFSLLLEEDAARVQYGLAGWELKDTTEQPVPINAASVAELFAIAPNHAAVLLEEIKAFNAPLEPAEGEPSKPS